MSAAARSTRKPREIVLEVALAYSRLSPRTHAQVKAFLAGDHSIEAAYDVATLVAATTSTDDLVPILARLLVMADDEVGEQEVPAWPADATGTHSIGGH